jgi:hypothetical protein
MRLHLNELELAQAYDRSRSFEELDARQMHLIMDRARFLFEWFRAHPRTHNLISGTVILFVLAADAFALLGLPRWLLAHGRDQSFGWILFASSVAGGVHCWLMYSLVVFSLHEGAAHNLIFAGTGRLAKAGQRIAGNLCRLSHGEPDHYSACHMAHHAKFGTEHDPEFLNFVTPRRFWLAFLPLAAFMNVTDFMIHRPPTYTWSRALSGLLSLLYNGVYAYLIFRSFGLAFTLLTMLVFTPHVGFYLDRLRQFTEHNLMPLENPNGARSFGIGFWGILIGGGPWGQPCHWAHHLAPGIPWYQQILLHLYIKNLLTGRQREQFMLTPFIGFPRLLWQVIRDTNTFGRRREVVPN